MLAHRYLFVGGLHRSGTSLAARLIGGLAGVSSITGAPVPENEGVYLQGAIPHTAQHGRPMHFATDPAQHLIEGGRWDRLDVRTRLEADWAPWFRPASWRVEKSPVNLTRMRLYQQLYPLSQFVVVLRHPEAVAAAVSKWVDAPAADLIDHWIAAHAIVEEDIAHLHDVVVLRYEDMVADPSRTLARLAAFLGLPPGPVAEDVTDGNARYAGSPRLLKDQARAAARWGYGPDLGVTPLEMPLRHRLRAVREATLGV